MAFHEKYIISIIVFSLFRCILGQNTCGKLDTRGYTVPHGDIVLRYGEPLDITCNLHPEVLEQYGANASSRLSFSRNHVALPPEMIEILNSTSIRLHIDNHTRAKTDNYYCLFRTMNTTTPTATPINTTIATTTKSKSSNSSEEVICLNVVIVGVPPQNVTDFSCIGRNYENLTCTWTPPENYVRTDYNLTYYLQGRAARFTFGCPKLEKLDNGTMSCFWDVTTTTPQYRQVQKFYYFRIGMNNTFGSVVNHFDFEHFKYVLPNPPEHLKAIATSPHSIHLSWVLPSSMQNFLPGLHHRILYQCEYYDKVWQFGGLIQNFTRNKRLEFELEGLKYAHALCDIRVSMRSAYADPNDESMWSDNATVTTRTESKVPDCPPKTNIGSFEIVNNGQNRDAYVYWQQLREEQKNGQNFSYYVQVQNHPLVYPVELSKAYARFQNLSASDNYIVNIWSVNKEGRSAEKSTVILPANRIKEPINFIKVAHREDLYELSWEPPRQLKDVEEPHITNYTIFWCSNERDRPYQCVGNLNWTVVPKDTRKYNQTLPGSNIYQFAISANSRNNSSGMSWAECTIIPNRIMGKIKNVWIMNVGSDFIDVGWELDCLNKNGQIQGFIVYYCPIESPILTNCKKTTEKNITLAGDVRQSIKITDLEPYTTYRVTVGFIISHSTYSQTSEPLLNTTHEAAPSTPPLNVEIFNVTNSQISLRWQPPPKINGVLKYYYIYYNKDSIKIDPYQNETTLMNLDSFVKYTISMKACTVYCSRPSPPKTVTTEMWIPGTISQPSIIDKKGNDMIVFWDRPDPPRGEVNYYEVKFKLENKTLKYENVTTQNYSVEGCSSGQYKAIFISVRAVNIVKGEHLHGPWSAELRNSCTPYTLVVYILIVVAGLISLVGAFFVGKRLYLCCRTMHDIKVELPPGLAPCIQHDLVPWSSEKHVEDIDRSSRADEELLLQQISGIRLSGESSGCSSAHDSITSSLESTNQISPTDSGTEHPRSPSLSEESRRNSLRQRNVSATRPTINKGYVIPDAVSAANWAPKSAPASGENYCVLGVDPNNQTEKETPYVSISDMTTTLQMPYTCDMTQPPPYVMTGDFFKTPNPGYVPYSATEPADKNTGYVVAGLTKDLLAPELHQCDTQNPTNIEEKPLYSKADDPSTNLKGVQSLWQQPALETNLSKSGYVTVGDAPPPKTISDVTKGYVPHRQFEAKSLKKD